MGRLYFCLPRTQQVGVTQMGERVDMNTGKIYTVDETDPENWDPVDWPDKFDTKNVSLCDALDEKRLTYEEVKQRACEKLLRGETNEALLLVFVMLEMEEVGGRDAYFWNM